MTKSGSERYPNRTFAARQGACGDDFSLGRPLLPADIYITLRFVLALEDDEIRQLFVDGAAALGEGAEGYLAAVDDRDAAIQAATSVTSSRLSAWRKRGRQMTWDELRVFLLGLKSGE